MRSARFATSTGSRFTPSSGRRGHSPEEAEDLTQGFFTRLLEPDFLKNVDRSKGKFRAFLLASCKYYLANERERPRRSNGAATGC